MAKIGDLLGTIVDMDSLQGGAEAQSRKHIRTMQDLAIFMNQDID